MALRLSEAQGAADEEYASRFRQMRKLEERNNGAFIEAYGLRGELSPNVSDEEITLYQPNLAEEMKRLISYVIGCRMGRYSIDAPGLVYAYGDNQRFEPDRYVAFRANQDGIIPLIERDWGIKNDALTQIIEFIGVVWPKESLEENLKFIAEGLDPNNNDQPRDTISRYLAAGFFKHHLSMYKKRPIYWLFSSGKQRAFPVPRLSCIATTKARSLGCGPSTSSPSKGKLPPASIRLRGDKAKAASTSHRKKLQKEQDELKKQQAELVAFDEKLKHFADQKISLDLDDGVKVNYGKFGDLLAEVRALPAGRMTSERFQANPHRPRSHLPRGGPTHRLLERSGPGISGSSCRSSP